MNADELTRVGPLPPEAPEWTAIDDARTLFLRFRDLALEASYSQSEFERNHRQIVGTSLVILVLITGFYWLDPWIAPRDALGIIRWGRVWVAIPSALVLVIGAVLIRRVMAWRWLCGTMFTLYLLRQSANLLILGPSDVGYFAAGMAQGLVGLFFASNLPLRLSFPIGVACEQAFFAVAMAKRVALPMLIDLWAADAVIIFAFCTLAVYRYEKASRAQFVAQERFRRIYEHRLAAEVDRRRWLEVFADFLGHELKNSLIGIASSIELASRLRAEPVVDRYFERARRSLDTMRRLLRQVTVATNLESALERQTSVIFDLAPLIENRVADFSEAHPGRSFQMHLTPLQWIEGNPDAMLQVLDKLFGNAIEHGDAICPIVVTLEALATSCRLTVRDVGDALPTDCEAIFKPFVTLKNPATRDGNLGLGLFVARTIVGHHRGTLRAEPLAGAVGAQFVVELPRASTNPQVQRQRDDSVAGEPVAVADR